MRKILILLAAAVVVSGCAKQKVTDFQLGEQYRLLGNYDQALEQYRAAIKNGDNAISARFGTGLILETRDKLQAAADEYKKVLDARPDFPGIMIRYKMVQGKQLVDAGDYEKAYAVIREILITEVLGFKTDRSAIQAHNEKYFDKLAAALITIGSGYEQKQEWDTAARYYRQAVEINSGSAAGNLRLGAMYYTQGKILTALRHLSKAQQIDPEDPETGYLLGHCYYTLQDYESAYREWLKVKSVSPGYRDTARNLSMAWNKRMWEFLKFQTAVDSIALNLQEISQMKNELRQAVEHYKELGEIVQRAGDIAGLKQKIDTVLVYQDRMAPMIDGLSRISEMRGDLEKAVKYQIVLKDILVGLEDITDMKDRVMEVIGQQEQTHEIVTSLSEIAAMKTDLRRATDYQAKVADVIASLDRISKLKSDIQDVLKYQDKRDFAAIVENLGEIADLKDELTQAKTTVALTLAMLGSQSRQSQQTLAATLEQVKEYISESDRRIEGFILETTDKQLNAVVQNIEQTREAQDFVSDETVILWQQVITALSEQEKKTLTGFLALSPAEVRETMQRLDLSTTEKYLIEAVQSLAENEKHVVAGIANGTYSTSTAN